MLDEFEDASWSAGRHQGAPGAGTLGDPVARLITRLYAASDERLRARLLGRLLKPLGSLGLVAVAAGAFAGFLQRRSAEGFKVSIEDASRFSGEQITELVRFVGQVSPESLQSVAGMLVDNPMAITAIGASALMLLLRNLRLPDTPAGAQRVAAGAPTDASASRSEPAEFTGHAGAPFER